jgi:hypothetical protein
MVASLIPAGRHFVMLRTNPTSTCYISVARCWYFTELVFLYKRANVEFGSLQKPVFFC